MSRIDRVLNELHDRILNEVFIKMKTSPKDAICIFASCILNVTNEFEKNHHYVTYQEEIEIIIDEIFEKYQLTVDQCVQLFIEEMNYYNQKQLKISDNILRNSSSF